MDARGAETAERRVTDRWPGTEGTVTGLALAEVDYATDTIHLSDRAARLFGIGETARIVPRAAIPDYLHPEDRETFVRLTAEATDPAGPGWFEWEPRVLRPDGRIRWLLAQKQVFFEGEGTNRRPRRATLALTEITPKKQAETVLRSVHDTFRHLVENSPFGVYVVDADFRLAHVSAGAQKVFQNIRPLIGRDFAEVLRFLWPEPFSSEAIERFHRTLQTGEPYHAPDTVENRQDIEAVESYDWKIERVLLPDGRFGVVCHFYDLSERNRYESRLREQQKYVMEITSLVPGVLYVFDLAEKRNVFVNRRTGDVLGYGEDEILALGDRFVPEVIHPEDAPRMEAHIGRVAGLADGEIAEIEYRFRDRNGSWRWFQSRDTVFKRDESGQVRQILGIATEVTDRKLAEERLGESEQKLRLAVDAGQAGTFRHDLATDRVEWSPQLERTMGLAPGEFGGTFADFFEFVHPDDEAQIRETIRDAIARCGEYAFEFRMVRRDGAITWLTGRGCAYGRAGVGAETITGVTFDITERKRAEQEIRELNGRLHRAVFE
ncbi:MAG: PAS domain-containing protein, partial [Capsulimonadales bacterium]|nr:PAS domain-containing protein [Capsulimonadales bacterium]